jgi:hypothetical protein
MRLPIHRNTIAEKTVIHSYLELELNVRAVDSRTRLATRRLWRWHVTASNDCIEVTVNIENFTVDWVIIKILKMYTAEPNGGTKDVHFIRMAVFWEVVSSSDYTVPNYTWLTLTHVSVKLTALMTEAVSASETSVNSHQTKRRDVPKDSRLHTRRCENLKSHTCCIRPSIVITLRKLLRPFSSSSDIIVNRNMFPGTKVSFHKLS